LKITFEKLSIHSTLLDYYQELILKPTHHSNIYSFINECRIFLREYEFLLDRYTSKTIRDHFLVELEHATDYPQRAVQISARIIQFLKPILDVRLQQKQVSSQSSPIKHKRQPINDSLFKQRLVNVRPTWKMVTCGTQTSAHSHLPRSNIFYSDLSSHKYETDHHALQSLTQCYYRHIRQHAESIIQRSNSLCRHEQRLSTTVINGKALVVAGQKLLFVLETLHEHVGGQRYTPLDLLTRQLNDVLTCLLESIKQLSERYSHSCMSHFRQSVQTTNQLVKRINLQCS
jgi:hypothetical protein